MEDKRYPIPPDLTIGKYVGGYTWMELIVIAIAALLAIVAFSKIGLKVGAFMAAVPAAIAILCHRSDNGTGYVNALSSVSVMLRYNVGCLIGSMDFSLRRMLQLDKQAPTEQEEKENEQ